MSKKKQFFLVVFAPSAIKTISAPQKHLSRIKKAIVLNYSAWSLHLFHDVTE